MSYMPVLELFASLIHDRRHDACNYLLQALGQI